MIIFGWRGRLKTLWAGMFSCPYERAQREGRLLEVRRWFTLFFIPVIPLRVLARGVQCSGCGLTFDERVAQTHQVKGLARPAATVTGPAALAAHGTGGW